MRLHIIGTGCPHPTPEAYGSVFVLEVGRDLIMVDCGPATTYKMVRMGISPKRVHHVFLTHHHFDHNVDLACFALTRWDQCIGPEPPLKVYGPRPTELFVERLLGEQGAFYDDWYARLKHPASHFCHTQRGGKLPRPAPAIEAKDVGPGQVAQSDAWAVAAQRVHHVEPWLESLAYRFETDEGSVVFAGDCADCPELRAFAKRADTIVMACTHSGRGQSDAAIVDVITGTPEAAAIANEAGVRRVVLTHVSPGYARPGARARAVAEIARAYDGEIVFPDELETVELTG